MAIDVTETGAPCAGSSGCTLHLHSLTSYVDRPNYRSSAATAVGVAAANGNTGDVLLPYSRASTYVTSDAGVTWRMVRPGPHLHAFGDSGALLVIVNDADPTDHLRYSWDYGRTWQYYRFASDEKLRVHSLTSSLDATSQRFLLLGEAATSGATVALGLDFTGVQPRVCSRLDYEAWSPSDYTGTTCLLGHEVEYQRRRANVSCAVGAKYTSPILRQEHCTCTVADFECDLDYDSQGDRDSGYTCVPADGNTAWDPPQSCPVGSTYTVPSGFRRVPISTCVGGVDRTRPLQRSCGSTAVPTVPVTSAPGGGDNGGGDGGGGSGSTLHTAAIVAGVLGAVAASILVIAGLVVWRRVRQADPAAEGTGSSWSRTIKNIKYKAVRQEDIETEEFLVDDY